MRVLIADDNSEALKRITNYLEPYADCKSAGSGAEVMQLVQNSFDNHEEFYSLFIIDVHLGDVSGFDLLKQIRMSESEHGVPKNKQARVIFTTPTKEKAIINRALNEGNAMLVKPLNRGKLLVVVESIGLSLKSRKEEQNLHANETVGNTKAAHAKKPFRALVVDDSLPIRNMIKKHLDPYTSNVDTAVDGRQALEKYAEARDHARPFQLICLDIIMPEVNGLTVLKQIREVEKKHNLPEEKKTKIILISALNEKEKITEAISSYCDAFLTKPFDEQKFLATLRTLEFIS